MQRVSHPQHEVFYEGVDVAEAWQQFQTRGVTRQNTLRDFLNESATEIKMQRLHLCPEPDLIAHAAWHYDHATRWDGAATLALSDSAMDCDRAIEVQDDQRVVNGVETILERHLSLEGRIQRLPGPAIA